MKSSIKKARGTSEMNKAMQAKIRSGFFILKLPLEKPKISRTGKTKVIASSHGLKRAGVRFNGGQEIYVVANVCIYAEEATG